MLHGFKYKKVKNPLKSASIMGRNKMGLTKRKLIIKDPLLVGELLVDIQMNFFEELSGEVPTIGITIGIILSHWSDYIKTFYG